jgi:Mg2+ and Co2+ transporter CorA
MKNEKQENIWIYAFIVIVIIMIAMAIYGYTTGRWVEP